MPHTTPSHPAENDAPYEVTVEQDTITAACACGSGLMVRDQGLGRATVAAWRTRHQACPIPPAVTDQPRD